MDGICELGCCPYAEPYTVEAYDLSCNDCQHYVEIDNWTDEELESLQTALKKRSVSTGINIADLFDANPEKHAWKKKSKTNADRIRSMTDEELTIFLAETSRCSDWCNLYEKCKTKTDRSYSVCLETWNDWLKEESGDSDV